MERDLEDLKALEEKMLLTENPLYASLAESWGNVFTASMGAERFASIVTRSIWTGWRKKLRREEMPVPAQQAAAQEGRQAAPCGGEFPQE